MKLPAYTLIEMLVVLTIFVIISAIGYSTFGGLRDTVTLNEESLTLEQDIRFAQRSSLFLERQANERWIYGVGLDFSDFEQDGVYRLFKWCSPFNEFGATETKSDFPNFDPGLSLSASNGNLPTNPYQQANCLLDTLVSEVIRAQGRVDGIVSASFIRELPDSLNAVGDIGGIPVYILFESVSGRAFFYDENGVLVNYDISGDPVSEPSDFEIRIGSRVTNKTKVISISNVSGKVSIQTE